MVDVSASGAQVAVITGGSSGIGLATARRFVAEGWSIAIAARDPARLQSAAEGLGAEGRVLPVVTDVAIPGDAEALIASTRSRFGRIDALINAHGVIGELTSLEESSPTDWAQLLDIDLLGAVWTVKAAIAALRQTRGAVVNVSSVNAEQAESMLAPYGVAKAGLVALSRYAALELAADGIRVNAILAGWVRTPMAAPFLADAELDGCAIGANMLGRAAEPSEIASAVWFLCGGDASFITGAAVAVDGGQGALLYPLRPLSGPPRRSA